jgi:glycosyltransferase involved in cell wall biosynthesis
MIFVFWQGIISIHQKSFLEAVAARAGAGKVLLVVENDITPYRKNMGWDVPEIKNVTVLLSPPLQQVQEIVHANKNAVHILGGIRVGRLLSAAFDECVRQGCKMGIMTEPYNDAGAKGMLRTLKYRYYKLRYFRHIQFVLAIGRQGVEQYSRLGFDTNRIFPWAYFISVATSQRSNHPKQPVRIMYAGRLEAAKGISKFMDELMKSDSQNYSLDLYGTGADEEKMKQLVTEKGLTDRICFYPFLKYEELLTKYAHYDWVVLPSTAKDGWGVIVSEGLLNGLKAICSNICGVSRVITNGVNGVTFDWNEPGSCSSAIKDMLGNDSFASTAEIAAWAQKGISASAGADYLYEIMDCVYDNKSKPGLPWEGA